jgi:hypothetical protein
MSRPERWNHWAVERLPCKFDNDDGHDTYPAVAVPGGNPCGHPDHRHHWRPPASSVYVSSGKQEQDARLMAAAPDLLAALESIVSLDLCCATLEEKHKADAVFAAARAAITQATGGEK